MVFVRVIYPFELEFGNIVYCGGRKTGEHGEKPSEQDERLSPHMALGWHWTGIEPGQHWWEASALTTAPSLLPISSITVNEFSIAA